MQREEVGLVALKKEGTTLPARVVDAALKNPSTRTADLGGKLGTQDFGKTVAAKLG